MCGGGGGWVVRKLARGEVLVVTNGSVYRRCVYVEGIAPQVHSRDQCSVLKAHSASTTPIIAWTRSRIVRALFPERVWDAPAECCEGGGFTFASSHLLTPHSQPHPHMLLTE